jgi:cation:H+ antiporter
LQQESNLLSLIGTFVLLSCVIVCAGVLLTKFADKIAESTAMGHSLAGLLLLAAATSLPELSIGWAAVRIDAVDLTLGELLGSCLWNLLLLAILDLAIRSGGRMLSRQSAAHALTATVSVLLVAIVMGGLVLGYDHVFLRLSPFSWAILAAYILCIRLIYQDHQTVINGGDDDSGLRRPTARSIVGYLVCASLIFIAAPRLAVVSDQLAEVTGIADTFLGATLVALVTSLPEAVTTFAAIRLGQPNMALANIFGSNAFNIVILAMVDLATPDSIFALASSAHLVTAVCVTVVSAVALLGLLYRAEKRYWLIEPDALLVILLVIGSLILVYDATT